MVGVVIKAMIKMSLEINVKLLNKKATEDFPILHGYFQSLIDFRKMHYINQKYCILCVVTYREGYNTELLEGKISKFSIS